RLAERLQRIGPNRRRVHFRREFLHLRASRLNLLGAKSSRLYRNKVWRSASRLEIGVQLALKELPHKNRTAFVAHADHIADQDLVEARCQLRSEIADLIGVRKQHERWRDLSDQLLQRRREPVRRVVVEQFVIRRIDAIELLGCQLVCERIHALAGNCRGGCFAQTSCKLLRRRERLERHAVPRAAALFHNCQNAAHSTRTSNLSFSTSFDAASFALPLSNCVCLDFCGRYTRSMLAVGEGLTPRSPTENRFTSLVFAFLMPIKVA